MRKTIAGLCWHCLKMVWSNSYTMNTSRLTTVRKTIAPSCKWVSSWGSGGGGGHTDIPVFFEKRTHRDHVWLQPMPAAESLVLCSSSDSVTIQSSATFSYCVLASILLAGIETRPLTHTHTHTLFLAQLQNNLHVHIYDLSYTSLSMVLLNIIYIYIYIIPQEGK